MAEDPITPRRAAQWSAGWGAEVGIRALVVAFCRRTGEKAVTLAPRYGALAGGVALGGVVAIAFGWWDARNAPEAEKADAYIDALIRGTGSTVTYRETYRAVSGGLVKAVVNAPPNDPIHNSILGQMVRQAQREASTSASSSTR